MAFWVMGNEFHSKFTFFTAGFKERNYGDFSFFFFALFPSGVLNWKVLVNVFSFLEKFT